MINAEFEVVLAAKSLVLDDPDSVAAAVRQYLRVHLPGQLTKSGYAFCTATIHVEAEAREIADGRSVAPDAHVDAD